jgi:hypothetical protein
MKIQSLLSLMLLIFGTSAHAYEGPSPLKNVKVDLSITTNSLNGLYSYSYSVSNPSMNDGEVGTINISIRRDPITDVELPATGLNQCPHFSIQAAKLNLAKTPMVPVGSIAPKGWSCDYMPQGTFTFGANDNSDTIKPGKSLGPFVLTSYAPPGIREILVEPVIDYQAFPSEWEGDSARLLALHDKVNWSGKTIGPKAPPKVFVARDFINYLISLKDQSVSLGWIKEIGIANSLDVKLNEAKKRIVAGDNKTAKNVLGAFQNELQAQNGKQLTSEAYALLYFNAKYLIDHL